MIGGSQRTGDTLLRALARRGHEVALTAGLIGDGWLGLRGRILMKLTRRRAVRDRKLGYSTYRSWFPWQSAAEVARRFRPDVVVVQAHSTGTIGYAFRDAGQKVLFSFQDNEFDKLGQDLADFGPITAVANSRFTADAYRRAYGATCTTIHPLIDGDLYRTERTGSFVTFINPDPVKGLDKAIEIARALPNTPFRFQETWPIPKAERVALLQRLADLPNVTLAPRVNDMREVYAQTKILLVPSQWEEGYGRIASEAQFSGIPVIGSDRGGLPEAIGTGGLVIAADAAAQDWVDALRGVLESPDRYAELSASATAYAHRPELQLDRQIDQWEQAIARAAAN
ncbi:glycosyltransferase [Qipengyuania qiaonensis]|uniref:Glycosyltransferase n=1 Tax=Qipengyuania qiaonensis TaxID=2867240 RepID=A0ABS7JC61_9SPHN|nr:glycosyltransferase [Qipengyuania qiaonensis]MBX7483649.1 glycosyltransferase [Qipengyuania qiaonensis]